MRYRGDGADRERLLSLHLLNYYFLHRRAPLVCFAYQTADMMCVCYQHPPPLLRDASARVRLSSVQFPTFISSSASSQSLVSSVFPPLLILAPIKILQSNSWTYSSIIINIGQIRKAALPLSGDFRQIEDEELCFH